MLGHQNNPSHSTIHMPFTKATHTLQVYILTFTMPPHAWMQHCKQTLSLMHPLMATFSASRIIPGWSLV